MATNFQNRIILAALNSYMTGKIQKAAQTGISETLFELLLSDAQTATKLNITSDAQYTQYSYLNRFFNDTLEYFGVELNKTAGKQDFYNFYFKQGSQIKNITDLRILVHSWLCEGLKKQAYPNLGGGQKPLKDHDLNKWIMTAKQIETTSKVRGLNYDAVEKELTKNWDVDERFNFQNWLKYYQQGNAEKYNVKTANFIKQAFGPTHFNLPQSILDTRTQSAPNFNAADHKTQKQIEEDRAQALKIKMKSRIRALKLLLDKYNDLLPHQDLDRLFVEIHTLEKSISKLNVRATLEDCIIRTANRLKKMGFEQEAEILTKEADTVPVNLSGANTSAIVAKLEEVSNTLAGRDLIRSLAEADIMLNNVQLAQYFPELALAQSKLIEAFGYASNKVEDVIARLRGTKKAEKPEPAPLPTAPTTPVQQQTSLPVAPPEEKIQPAELMEKPVGQVKKTL